jgi:hypothetical protein
MIAWFQAYVGDGTFRQLPGSGKGNHLRVGATQLLMPTLRDDRSFAHEDTANHGVRVNPAPSIATNRDGPLEELPIV